MTRKWRDFCQEAVTFRGPPSGRTAQFGLQRRDPGLQRLVFLARQPGHVLDRLELLALDDIEVAQDFFGLVAHHGIDLALDTLGRAGGVVHQPADLVKEPIAGLGHWGRSASMWAANTLTMAIPAPRFKVPTKAADRLVMLWFPCNRIRTRIRIPPKITKRAR